MTTLCLFMPFQVEQLSTNYTYKMALVRVVEKLAKLYCPVDTLGGEVISSAFTAGFLPFYRYCWISTLLLLLLVLSPSTVTAGSLSFYYY